MELGDDWEPLGGDHIALEFPKTGSDEFFDALSVSSSRLSGLGADFDGDTCSATIVYSQEAISEVDNYLNSKEAYLSPQGGFKASTSVNTVNLVLKNMTG